MIHMRFRLDLMVSSLSRKNHAEIEKKMTTPTLPPPCMTSWKKIRSGPRGSFSTSYPLWKMKWYMRIMNIAMIRNSSMLEPPPFKILERAGVTRLICIPFKSVSWLLPPIMFLPLDSSLFWKILWGRNDHVRGVLRLEHFD